MPTFHYDGIDFYYEDDKNGGMPFIFLHGLGGNTKQTMGVMKETRAIRRISLDFRGHGKTIWFGTSARFSFAQFKEDVLALADYLKLSHFMVGGISTGAGVALKLAIDCPDRVTKLVLSRPAWENKPQPKKIQTAFRTIYEILIADSIVDKKAAFRATSIYQEMDKLAHYAGDTLLGQFDYPYAKETADKLRLIPKDCPNRNLAEWQHLNLPTLILASKQDPIHPFEYGELLHQYIKHSEFREITPKEVSGQKHNEDSYRYIKAFL